MTDSNKVTCPYDEASFFSKATFWWLNPLFRTGYKKRLEPSDLYCVPRNDEARLVETRLSRCWAEELGTRGVDGASLLRATLRSFKWDILLPAFPLLLSSSIAFIQPILVGRLLRYFSPGSDMSDTEAYLYGMCLSLAVITHVFCNPLYFHIMAMLGMRVRTAMAGVIFKKVLQLNSKSFAKAKSGNIINLMSTDIEKLVPAAELIHHFWVCPIFVVVAGVMLYRLLGIPSLFAMAVIVAFLPVQLCLGALYGKWRLKIGKCGDERVHMMTEIISGMKIVKMYCWERSFSQLINHLRNQEIGVLRESFIFRGSSMFLGSSCVRIGMMLAFIGNWLCGYPSLSLPDLFMIIGWFAFLHYNSNFAVFASINCLFEITSCLKRIQDFLIIDEDGEKGEAPGQGRADLRDGEWAVDVRDVCASWGSVTHEDSESRDQDVLLTSTEAQQKDVFSLKSITLRIDKGDLIAIIGTVGSGKSSFLSTVLKDLPYQEGNVEVSGALAYCAQRSWVFSGTVRDNIVMGETFDKERYENVIYACALTRDVSVMPHGDLTFVGERGLMLSGGQKARVTLARAVYQKADIYVLDDPLSAVDTKVGKHIFEHCVCGFLKGKTRVLVTHQLQYLAAVDRIVVMNHGEILDTGTYEELLSRDLNLSVHLTMTDSGVFDDEEEEPHGCDLAFKISDTAEKVEDEMTDSGSVNWKVYIQYIKAGKGYISLPLILLMLCLFQSLKAYGDWLLAQWSKNSVISDAYNGTNTSLRDRANYSISAQSAPRNWHTMEPEAQKYIIAGVLYCICATLTGLALYQMPLVASKNLHNKMFRYVLGAKLNFFDKNPTGRILNRFARDIGFLDSTIANVVGVVLRFSIEVFVVIIITLMVSPWLLIPVTPVVVFIIILRYYAVQTTRDVRRLEGIARSPVYSHVSDTIHGLQTIRAMKKEEEFFTDFVKYQNIHTSAWFTYICSYRWFSIRTIFSLAIYSSVVNFVCIALGQTLDRTLLALALSYCTAITEPFEYVTRTSAELENLMTSVERVVSYTSLEQEGPRTSKKPPPECWPQFGAITFQNVSLRYSENHNAALKDLTFQIQPSEKIGIVGRTGSGKSSLLAAFLRLTEPDGTIIMDHVDVTKIGLHELRSKLSVIPQDPVLFSGTLRRNLDPFEEFEDDVIWKALQQVQLKSKVNSISGELDMEVSESGSNFSVGERQLICLARALLRRNKILALDEATANVDNRTDELIQRTIREEFSNCTVLTIAHRLHTVMDYDRIMVLDDGQIAEFDSPARLLQNKDGILFKLAADMGKQHLNRLAALAEKNNVTS